MDTSARSFRFKTGSCDVKGALIGSTFTLTEAGCEDFHTGECSFAGAYKLKEW